MDKKAKDTKTQAIVTADLKKLEDTTLELTITVPWNEVQKSREEAINALIKSVEVAGFRKGNVPKNIAVEKLNAEKINEETLKKILPQTYIEAVKSKNLNPIINPRIHVETFSEGTNLVFKAETAEEPTIDLKNYKEQIQKLTAASKIIVPGKTERKVNLDEIIETLIKNTDVKASKLLSEHEANRLLSNLLDELKKLGMTLDGYLTSRGKTAEQLRAEYEEKALNDIKLEFLLRKIADVEKITVEQKEIDEVIAKMKDEKGKAEALKNPYLLSAIIRQQKTLDFLAKI